MKTWLSLIGNLIAEVMLRLWAEYRQQREAIEEGRRADAQRENDLADRGGASGVAKRLRDRLGK